MAEPIYPDLPQSQAAFVNKYDEIGSTLLPLAAQNPQVVNSLIQYDLSRVQRGQRPLSKPDTAYALAAALKGQPITPAPHRSFLSRVRDDAFAIASTVPKLPMALVKEVQALPTAGQRITEALSAGENPITAVARAPGVRLIPGSYTVGNIAAGEGSAVMEHPLMTALDVLPYVSKAAGATKIGRLAEAEKIRPLKALATRRINPSTGKLVPNRAGVVIEEAAATAPGQLLRQAFGKDARSLARLKNKYDIRLQELGFETRAPLTGDVEIDRAALLTRDSAAMIDKYGDLGEARMRDLTRLMQENDAALSFVTDPHELSFVSDVRDMSARLAHVYSSSGFGGFHNGEFYDESTISKLLGAQQKASRAQARALMHVPRLQALAATDTRIQAIVDALQNNDFTTANREYNKLSQRRTNINTPSRTGKGGEKSNFPLSSVRKLGTEIRDAAKTTEKYAKLQSRTAPARFLPMVGKEATRKLESAYKSDPNFRTSRGLAAVATAEEAAQIAQAVQERIYTNIPGYHPGDFESFTRDVQSTWQQMKAAGADPVFVHHVDPAKEGFLTYPKVLEAEYSPSASRERIISMAPYIEDATIGMTHQGLEFIARKMSEQYIGEITQRFAKTEQELIDQYLPAGRVATLRHPGREARTWAQDFIRKEWHRYEPKEFVAFPQTHLTGTTPDNLYLPRHIYESIVRAKKPGFMTVTAPFDATMGLFRTAVLPLSPRWQVYNVIGSAITTGIENPRAFLKLRESARMLREPKLMPEELRVLRNSSTRLYREFNYYSGKTLGRIFQSVQDNRALGKIKDVGGKVIQKSFDLNSWFDDLYRGANYLSGYDKALSKGLTRDEAIKSGMELSRRVLQSWDEITPIERSILRYVFPFYTFAQFITRFAMRYPMDHPWRMAVVGSFARNELADLGEGLPQNMLNSFFVGDENQQGDRRAISLAGLNPFSDVSNTFSIAGFLSGVNPLISTVAEQMGVNTRTGSPELYPDLTYDPETGRLAIRRHSLPESLVGNIIPQANVLLSLAKSSSEYKQIMRTNPEAARRMILSQSGLPVLLRDWNVPQEQFRAEVARKDAAQTELNSALKEGRDSTHPAVRPLLSQVRALQSTGALATYQQASGQTTNEQLRTIGQPSSI